jgi:Mn-dependent DtxR family transcriptional regulator
METWKEFDANELTHSAAHHLLAIHEIGKEYGGWARVSDIARLLGITRGSVSINLRALKKRGLVLTDEHRMVKLSPPGAEIVHRVRARKTAVKEFLREVLDLTEKQAELDSCRIEHLVSQNTNERLVHWIRFLRSADPLAQDVRARLRQFDREPARAACPTCGGACLLQENETHP